jgi:hypothetical protein
VDGPRLRRGHHRPATNLTDELTPGSVRVWSRILIPPGYPGDLPCPTEGAAIKDDDDEDQGTLQGGAPGVRQERHGETELH